MPDSPTPDALTGLVKRRVLEAGFDDARVANSAAPPVLAHFKGWIEMGRAGIMDYLVTQADRRSDLRTAFPWARSIIVAALQYDTPHPYSTDSPQGSAWIARYAWGDDYHDVVRARLEALRQALGRDCGSFESRAYVDTGPVAEKAYAVAAGLGSYGKNTCVLNQKLGSWFFIGVLITDLDLAPDAPTTDICGSCRACLDACPTQAFPEPYVLDARRCISYLTIEVKDSIDPELRGSMGRQVFGCDICQDVCPWNRKRLVSGGEPFEPRAHNLAPSFEELASLTPDAFQARFRKNPIKRTKRRGLLRNVAVAIGNAGSREHLVLLDGLMEDEDPVVREHAAWGRDRLRARLAHEDSLRPGRV
ncbi:MAG: tRNA epoxyqueuosine(34) reductase QueG [Vicinamibacteria bacterium]|nr:tRNA epoxyqueuosine(34) reductase QueG [Vicinamibacteria bacterium]